MTDDAALIARLHGGVSQCVQRDDPDKLMREAADRIAALTAELTAQQDAAVATVRLCKDEVRRAEAERDALRKGYAECLEDLQCWAAYAGEYFQKKHDLAGDIARHSAALASKEPKHGTD